MSDISLNSGMISKLGEQTVKIELIFFSIFLQNLWSFRVFVCNFNWIKPNRNHLPMGNSLENFPDILGLLERLLHYTLLKVF